MVLMFNCVFELTKNFEVDEAARVHVSSFKNESDS